MTKNKSLFSGVGDGNRVKSIRLQGDKHTQGKKGKEKNCECGQGGSQPRAPANLPPPRRPEPGWGEGGEEREGRGGEGVRGQREWESPGAQWPSCKTKPQPGQLTLAEATTRARGRRPLLHGTSALGTCAPSVRPGCLAGPFPAQLHLGTVGSGA